MKWEFDHSKIPPSLTFTIEEGDFTNPKNEVVLVLGKVEEGGYLVFVLSFDDPEFQGPSIHLETFVENVKATVNEPTILPRDATPVLVMFWNPFHMIGGHGRVFFPMIEDAGAWITRVTSSSSSTTREYLLVLSDEVKEKARSNDYLELIGKYIRLTLLALTGGNDDEVEVNVVKSGDDEEEDEDDIEEESLVEAGITTWERISSSTKAKQAFAMAFHDLITLGDIIIIDARAPLSESTSLKGGYYEVIECPFHVVSSLHEFLQQLVDRGAAPEVFKEPDDLEEVIEVDLDAVLEMVQGPWLFTDEDVEVEFVQSSTTMVGIGNEDPRETAVFCRKCNKVVFKPFEKFEDAVIFLKIHAFRHALEKAEEVLMAGSIIREVL